MVGHGLHNINVPAATAAGAADDDDGDKVRWKTMGNITFYNHHLDRYIRLLLKNCI